MIIKHNESVEIGGSIFENCVKPIISVLMAFVFLYLLTLINAIDTNLIHYYSFGLVSVEIFMIVLFNKGFTWKSIPMFHYTICCSIGLGVKVIARFPTRLEEFIRLMYYVYVIYMLWRASISMKLVNKPVKENHGQDVYALLFRAYIVRVILFDISACMILCIRYSIYQKVLMGLLARTVLYISMLLMVRDHLIINTKRIIQVMAIFIGTSLSWFVTLKLLSMEYNETINTSSWGLVGVLLTLSIMVIMVIISMIREIYNKGKEGKSLREILLNNTEDIEDEEDQTCISSLNDRIEEREYYVGYFNDNSE